MAPRSGRHPRATKVTRHGKADCPAPVGRRPYAICRAADDAETHSVDGDGGDGNDADRREPQTYGRRPVDRTGGRGNSGVTVRSCRRGGTIWRYLGSATLRVFWAVTVGYAVRTVGGIDYGERSSADGAGRPGIVRRTTAAVLSVAVGVLAWTVAVWGRAWTAVAVALLAGFAVHVLVGWFVAPAMVGRQLGADQPGQLVWGPDDIAPRPAVVVGVVGVVLAIGLAALGSVGWLVVAGVVGTVSIVLVVAGGWELRTRRRSQRARDPRSGHVTDRT